MSDITYCEKCGCPSDVAPQCGCGMSEITERDREIMEAVFSDYDCDDKDKAAHLIADYRAEVLAEEREKYRQILSMRGKSVVDKAMTILNAVASAKLEDGE